MSIFALPPEPTPGAYLPRPGDVASPWEKANDRRLRLLALALILIGLAWRCTRYFLCFPVWGDEAMLLVNYFTRDYGDLFGPIDNCQIAPLLYHIAALASLRAFGTSELAVRLPSFLACLGSLVLFWRLARLTLPPLARTISVGILAVSIWPATMGSLTKPYAFDLFISLSLLLACVSWLRQPARLTPLVVLVATVPLAVVGSYPAVFIGGGIAVALLPVVFRERRAVVWTLFVTYGLLLVGTFAAHYWFVGRPHLASTVGNATTAAGMQSYWRNGFPPGELFALLRWIVLAHVGQIAAYPMGASNGGSGLTFLLGTVGLVALWRQGHRRLVLLLFAVYCLWFIAACLHKYPYGSSCRLAQHVAPFYCLLAGLGVATLVQQFSRPERRWRTTLPVVAVLAAVGVGGVVRDCLKPYRDLEAKWAQALVEDLVERSAGEPILVLQPAGVMYPIFHWQLGRVGDRVVWGDKIDWNNIAQSRSSLWFASYGAEADEGSDILAQLSCRGRGWRRAGHDHSILCPEDVRDRFRHFHVYHFVRAE